MTTSRISSLPIMMLTYYFACLQTKKDPALLPKKQVEDQKEFVSPVFGTTEGGEGITFHLLFSSAWLPLSFLFQWLPR